MKRFDIVLQDEMTDGITSAGMGASTTVENNTTTTNTPTVMSEAEALSFLNGIGTGEQQSNIEPQTQPQGQDTNDFSINPDDIDMSMFGNYENEQVISVVPQQQQTQPQGQDVNPKDEIMQQILNKLNSNNQNETVQNEEIEILSQLASKMQKAGLLPNGLSEEDKQLLQDAKAMRDEIKQQKEAYQQQLQHQNKISAIDSFSKELEQTIPSYNNNFMINLVSQISNKNPQAGQQILNNPAMLITLWNKYGAKAQPKQQSTNVLSNGGGSPNINSNELFEKVKTGKATEDEELRLIASL